MGACATKPKVSKEGAEPIEKEEIVELGTDEKKIVDIETDVAAADTVKEVDDEETSKPRSLSNLLNESETEAKKDDSTEAKPVEAEASETVKPAEPELQVADHPAVEPEQKKEETPAAVPTTAVVEKIEVPVVEPEQKKEEKPAAVPAVEKVEVPVVEPTPVLSAPVKAEAVKVNEVATPKETVAEKTIQVRFPF